MIFKEFDNKQDILLLNTIYHKPRRQEDGKYSKDAISIVYRDLKTGQKKVSTVDSPKVPIYIVKEEVEVPHPLYAINREYVNEHLVSYSNRNKDIAELLGEKYVNYYWDMIKSKNRGATGNILRHKNVYGADLDIEAEVRIEYLRSIEPSSTRVTKAYYDIEVDAENLGRFPDEDDAPSPINALTYIFDGNKMSYTFLLRDKTNPQIQKLEDNNEEFERRLNDEIFNEILTDKKGNHMGYKFKVFYFDDEGELLLAFFHVLKTHSPDFALAWNARFDILTIINRLKRLGYDPAEVICDDEFKHKECGFYKDRNAEKEAERTDRLIASSKTVFLDQMINYAGIRKSGKVIPGGVGLSNIGLRETNTDKESYRHITTDITKLPRLDYELFVIYNIRDVLVQIKIEEKTEDVDTMLMYAISKATPYNKLFKQTIFMKNRVFKKYLDRGLVLGCNRNTKYGHQNNSEEDGESKEKFEGALVGDPLLNGHNGIAVNGVISKYVYKNVIDVDLSSLYPSIMRAFNIAIQTMYFKILIDQPVSEYENIYKNERYDRGGDMVDNLQTRQYITFAHKWLALPNHEELAELFSDIYGMMNNDSNFINAITSIEDEPINLMTEINKFVEMMTKIEEMSK